MRKAKLTLEKHVLPSCKSPIAIYEARLIFSIHDEAVDFIREFEALGRRQIAEKEALLQKLRFCENRIGAALKSKVENEKGKEEKLSKFIRVSALDRLLKVHRRLTELITNPL